MGAETDFGGLFSARRHFQPRPPIDGEGEFTAIDAERVAGWFAPDGAFSRSFPTYENRPGQLEMARQVPESFNRGKHVMVEAGTGIG
ncbi:MAG: hypothetical protein LIP77_02180, partial [Planctomycetes bacterium]|nr:hypothetical protein [Planctomycetota bacterium]